jgi:hypothetical protein
LEAAAELDKGLGFNIDNNCKDQRYKCHLRPENPLFQTISPRLDLTDLLQRSNVLIPCHPQGNPVPCHGWRKTLLVRQGSFILKAVCSNPRHKREESFVVLRPQAARVAFSVGLKYIWVCITDKRDRTKKECPRIKQLPILLGESIRSISHGP